MILSFGLGSDGEGEFALRLVRVDRHRMPGHLVDAGFQRLAKRRHQYGGVGWIEGWLFRCDRRARGVDKGRSGEARLHALAEFEPNLFWRRRDCTANRRIRFDEARMG